MVNLITNTNIHKALEAISKKHIVSVVHEANKYCFKYSTPDFSGRLIQTIDKSFVHDFINSSNIYK